MIPHLDFPNLAQRSGHKATYATHLKFWLFRPGYRFVSDYRQYKALKRWPVIGKFLGNMLWRRNCVKYASEIAQDAVVGAGLYVPHPYGIVVGRCEIGDNVELLQNTTIGKLRSNDASFPRIGNGVKVGAGAVILGSITIGENAVIGANAVVLQDVPDNATAVGNPARILA